MGLPTPSHTSQRDRDSSMNLNAFRLLRARPTRAAIRFRHPDLPTRPFSSTPPSPPEPSPAVVLNAPTPEAIAEQELDVEIVSPQDVHIGITQRAAEVCLLSNPTDFFVLSHSIQKATS